MRLRFELQVSLARIIAVVVLERPLDIDRMRIVSLDQIAVVAVHGSHQIGQGSAHAVGQAAPEPGRPGGSFDREVGKFTAVT